MAGIDWKWMVGFVVTLVTQTVIVVSWLKNLEARQDVQDKQTEIRWNQTVDAIKELKDGREIDRKVASDLTRAVDKLTIVVERMEKGRN